MDESKEVNNIPKKSGIDWGAIIIIVFGSFFMISFIGIPGTCSIDIEFRDGHYEQYDYVISYGVVETGLISHTVDVNCLFSGVKRLHYVTSIDVIEGK